MHKYLVGLSQIKAMSYASVITCVLHAASYAISYVYDVMSLGGQEPGGIIGMLFLRPFDISFRYHLDMAVNLSGATGISHVVCYFSLMMCEALALFGIWRWTTSGKAF